MDILREQKAVSKQEVDLASMNETEKLRPQKEIAKSEDEEMVELQSQDMQQFLKPGDPIVYQHMECPDRLSFERLRLLKEIIQENNFLTTDEILKKMNAHKHLLHFFLGKVREIQRPHVYEMMVELGYVYRPFKTVHQRRNCPQAKKDRAAFCSKLLQLKQEGFLIYFYDDRGFTLLLKRTKGWFRADEEDEQCRYVRENNIPLLALADNCNVACWKISEKGFQRKSYEQNVRKIFGRMVVSSVFNREKILVVDLDTLHCKDIVRRVAEEYRFDLMELPSYSKQLNPLYRWFNDLWEKLRREMIEDQPQLLHAMQNHLKHAKKDCLKEHIKASFTFAVMGKNGESF